MEWFTYLVYGLSPIVLFTGVGFIIVSIVLKLLIDSWARSRNRMAYSKEMDLMYDAAKGRRF